MYSLEVIIALNAQPHPVAYQNESRTPFEYSPGRDVPERTAVQVDAILSPPRNGTRWVCESCHSVWVGPGFPAQCSCGHRHFDKQVSQAPGPDFVIHGGAHDTVFRVEPRTQSAREWLDDNVQSESWQWFGNALCVEHRFIFPLSEGMHEAGFKLELSR